MQSLTCSEVTQRLYHKNSRLYIIIQFIFRNIVVNVIKAFPLNSESRADYKNQRRKRYYERVQYDE